MGWKSGQFLEKHWGNSKDNQPWKTQLWQNPAGKNIVQSDIQTNKCWQHTTRKTARTKKLKICPKRHQMMIVVWTSSVSCAEDNAWGCFLERHAIVKRRFSIYPSRCWCHEYYSCPFCVDFAFLRLRRVERRAVSMTPDMHPQTSGALFVDFLLPAKEPGNGCCWKRK